MNYNVNFGRVIGETTDSDNAALNEVESVRFRSLASAERRVRRACREYSVGAQIRNEAGWPVLRLDADGQRSVP